MHLYAPSLLPSLPGPLLRLLHRHVCSLRGHLWGSRHPSILYVSQHPYSYLTAYHAHVLREFRVRGYKFAPHWADPTFRARHLDPWESICTVPGYDYPEHDDRHTAEGIRRLQARIKRPGNWTPEDVYRVSMLG